MNLEHQIRQMRIIKSRVMVDRARGERSGMPPGSTDLKQETDMPKLIPLANSYSKV